MREILEADFTRLQVFSLAWAMKVSPAQIRAMSLTDFYSLVAIQDAEREALKHARKHIRGKTEG